MIQELRAGYGNLFEEELIQEIAQAGTFKEAESGQVLIDFGAYIRWMPLLISGVIKILRQDTEGDELLLYYLEQGETCSMTMTCCMGQTRSEIRAVAESDVRMIVIPVGKMDEWTARYRSWRSFVFESFSHRFNELLQTVDGIAFMNLDDRLVRYLKDKSRMTEDGVIRNTHQEIAYDLHSSRVVISRLLKRLEEMGKIRLHRNHIETLDL